MFFGHLPRYVFNEILERNCIKNNKMSQHFSKCVSFLGLEKQWSRPGQEGAGSWHPTTSFLPPITGMRKYSEHTVPALHMLMGTCHAFPSHTRFFWHHLFPQAHSTLMPDCHNSIWKCWEQRWMSLRKAVYLLTIYHQALRGLGVVVAPVFPTGRF